MLQLLEPVRSSALLSVLPVVLGLGCAHHLTRQAPDTGRPPRAKVVAAVVLHWLDQLDPRGGTILVVARSSLGTVARMNRGEIAELEALLDGRAVVRASDYAGACSGVPARPCIVVALVSYADDVGIATIRAHWGATVSSVPCSGSYEATFRVTWERGTARVAGVSDQEYGDCAVP